ncbi:Uncharacterized protein Rs2_02744 [Raphanus sativus]|nr:Uncharacterized protein Rs2_02744 [Raphanus sativus]
MENIADPSLPMNFSRREIFYKFAESATRLLRFWKTLNVKKGGKLMGVALSLLDRKATINIHRLKTFRMAGYRALPSIPFCSDDASSEVFSKTALFSLYGGDPTTHHWCSDVPPLLLFLPQMPPRLKLPTLSAATEGKLHLLIC